MDLIDFMLVLFLMPSMIIGGEVMRRTIKPPNSVIEITSVDRVRRIGYSLVCLVWCGESGDTFGRLFGIRLGGHFRPGPRLKVCSQLVFNVSLGLQFSWYRGRKDSF